MKSNIKNQYKLFRNITRLEYKGINNVRYKHIYYVGKIEDKQTCN